MAVGDTVIGRFIAEDPGMPQLGIVNAESGGTDADVLWRNIERATVPFTALFKVFQANAFSLAKVGKWIQLTAFPETEAPNFGHPPKSPAAAGLVLDAFGTGAYDALVADVFWVVVSSEDGRGLFRVVSSEDAEENIMVVKPRRNV